MKLQGQELPMTWPGAQQKCVDEEAHKGGAEEASFLVEP